MANDKKFVVKNGLQANNVAFVNESNATNVIEASMLSTDTLSFSGNSGQLFSISDTMSGVIFGVNDVSGIPSIEVDDTGDVRIAEFSGNVSIGTSLDTHKLYVQGNAVVNGTMLISNLVATDINVSGNLTVSGTTTYINSTALNIGDSLITLNADLPSGTAPTENAGIEINRGSSANVQFLWDETNDRWSTNTQPLASGNTTIVGFANVSVSVNTAAFTVGTTIVANTTGTYATQLQTRTWEAPGTIGSTTPNTGVFSAVTVNGNAIVNQDNTSGTQLTIRGATNNNNRLYVGYDTDDDVGRITAITEGTAFRNLILQGGGGNVGIGVGTNVPNGTLTVFNPATFNARTSGINVHRPSAYGQYGSFAYDSDAVYLSSTYSGGGAGVYGRFIFDAYDSTSTPVTRMLINASGNVGIGTASPGVRLDVSGSIRSSNSITIGTGGAYEAGSIYSDASWGMIFRAKQASPAAAQFRWANSADGELMRIHSDGNVGIGASSPTSKLHVVGNARIGQITDNTTAARLDITAGGSGSDSIIDLGYWGTFDAAIWHIKRHGADNTFRIAYAGGGSEDPVFVLNSSGNLGLGTVSPSGRLHVTEANKGFNNYGNINVFTNNTAAADIGGSIAFGGLNTTGGTNPYVFGKIQGIKEGSASSWNGALLFGTTAGTSAVVERMRLTSTGDLAIGTVGNLNTTSKLRVQQTGSTEVLELYATTTTKMTLANDNNLVAIQETAGAGMDLMYNAAGTLTSGLRLNHSGNIGIGTTGPNSLLNLSRSTATATPAATPSIILTNRNTSINGTIAGGLFVDTYRDISNPHYSGGIWFTRNQTAGNLSSSSDIVFGTMAEGGTGLPTERMRVTAGGNLGVGTLNATGPTGRLSVNMGSATSSGATAGLTAWDSTYALFGGTDTTSSAVGIGYNSTTGGSLVSLAPSVDWRRMNYLAQEHRFYSTGAVEAFIINSSRQLRSTAPMVAWNTTTPGSGVGSLHLGSASTTSNAGSAITFGARDGGNEGTAQAGIYINSDGTYGTRMYLATSNDYSAGSRTGLSIDHVGIVSAPRDSMRAKIFYDIDEPAYFLDPNATGTSLNVAGEIRGVGELSISNYAVGNMQLGAMNIGRTDTNYEWGGTWAGDIRLGILANCSETWELGIHDAADAVMSGLHYNGAGVFTIGRDIGWGTSYLVNPQSMRSPIFYDSIEPAYFLDPNATGTSLNLAGTAVIANQLQILGGKQVYPAEWTTRFQSSSDFVDGTLVTTDIPAAAAEGDSFIIEITGKSYDGTNPPFKVIAQGYLYSSTITSFSGINYGGNFSASLKVFEDGGVLKFWWPRITYWNSFNVNVMAMNGPTNNTITRNRVTAIANSTEPTGTKKQTINLVQTVRQNTWQGSTYIGSNGHIYGTRFYDADNGAYYLDPAETSVVNQINFGDGTRFIRGGSSGQTILGVGSVNDAYLQVGANYYSIWNAGNFNPTNYLPLTGGTISGTLAVQASSDVQLYLNGNGTSWAGIAWTDANNFDYMYYNGSTSTFAIGGSGSAVANKKLHVNGGVTIGSGLSSVSSGTNSLTVESHIYGLTYYNRNDNNARWDGSNLILRGASPTVYFRDTDHTTAMIHVNSNVFYVLRGTGDTETWSQVNSVWPLEINLNNNNAVFGGIVDSIVEVRGTLFRDRINTDYYLDPGANESAHLRGTLRFGDHGAGVVGLYDSYRYQLVFAMGDAYKGALNGTNVTSGYGLWWSHPNAGGVAANLTNHGLMCIVNGNFFASLDASTQAITDMRAPLFYDRNNTNYYLDPASTSYLGTVWGDRYFQRATGVPTNNLGDPTVTEMALFEGQFTNKTEFYTPANIIFETSSDGSTWSSYSVTDANKKALVGGDSSSSIGIPYNTPYFRVRFVNNGSYVYLNALYAWWSSNGHQTKVQIYRKDFGSSTWVQHTNSDVLVSSWPGHLYLPFSTIAYHPSTYVDEVAIVFIPTWNATYSANPISLSKMQIWGGYPDGRRRIYTVNSDRESTFPSSLLAPIFKDSDNSAFFLDLSSTSVLSVMRTDTIQRNGGNQAILLNNGTYTQFCDPAGTVKFWIGGSDAGNYFNNSTHYFRNTGSANQFLIYGDGSRRAEYHAGTGALQIYGDAGGWATGTFFLGSGGTNRGGFGALGSADALSNFWIGTSNSSPAVNIFTDGRVEAIASHRAPIFYNIPNTAYYIDGEGTSVLNIINATDVYLTGGGWFRSYGEVGLYSQSYGQHFYPDSGGFYWEVDGPLRIRDGYEGTIKGYVGYHDANGFGFLGGGGSWWLNTPDNAAMLVLGGSNGLNAFNSGTGRRLMIGGGDSDAQTNYYIGTNLENIGGDYNKLDLRWHTGIRMGAQSMYGGIRLYDSEDVGTVQWQFNGSSGYGYKYVWLYTNTNGIYSDTNGAHFHPNGTTSYGQWYLQGSKGSYGGITDGYSGVSWMHDSGGNGGMYREASGIWYYYYHVANSCLGVSGSSTSSSYDLYVSGAIYATSDIVAYSDVRKKENIITIESALDKVNQLRGVYYNKIGETARKTGVIAQEVNEVLPEVVTYADDVDEYGVNYGNFAGVFIEAIKELTDQVNALKKEIEELKNGSAN